MTPDLITIARRAVAYSGWRWMPGMLMESATGGARRRCVAAGEGVFVVDQALDRRQMFHPTSRVEDRIEAWFPVLDDPATLGCLLALVREARGGEIVIRDGCGRWSIETDLRDWDSSGDEPLVVGLVAALEAAPRRTT